MLLMQGFLSWSIDCKSANDKYKSVKASNFSVYHVHDISTFTEIFISNTSQESYANISNISIYKTFQFSYH